MEASDLHKAHLLGRKANKLVRAGEYSEAIDCHLQAIKKLDELLKKLSKENTAIKSIQVQSDFHKSQAHITTIIQDVSAKCQNWSKDLPKMSYQQKVRFVSRPPGSQMEVQEIRRNFDVRFDEADSLLQILSERKIHPEQIAAKKENEKPIEFTIRPRNDNEVIEELQTVNFNLRNLVDKLLNELHEVKAENTLLKKKLSKYESIEVLGQSVEKSQYAIMEPLRQLPDLAPLEEPDFDFSSIISNST